MPLNPFQELLSSISHQKQICQCLQILSSFLRCHPPSPSMISFGPNEKTANTHATTFIPSSREKNFSYFENFKESMESHPKNHLRNFGESPLKISKKHGMIWWFFGASMVIFPGLQKIAPTFRSTWMNNAARKTACGSKRFGAAFKDGWIHPRWIQGFLLNFFVVAFGRLFMLVFFKHPLKRFKLVDDTELYLYDTTLWIIVLSHVNSLWSYEKPNNNWKNSPTFQRWKCPAPPGHFGWPSAPTIAEICFLNLLVVQ